MFGNKLVGKFLVLVIVVLGIFISSYATEVDLEKIVVTPSRIEEFSGDVSRDVDVVTAKEIVESGAQDLASVLTNLTSVYIGNDGGPNAVKSIKMRGSTAAQVLILMDGRPVNSPRDGMVDLSTIPLDSIFRVEVMRGPGSSLYGSSAMGGVVNIITKNPPKEGQKAELYTSFGTAQTYIEHMLYGANISKFNFLISGGYQSSQGFRENSELSAEDCNIKLGYELNSENKLGFNTGFYKSKVGVPGPVTSPDLDDKQSVLKRFFDLNWNFKPDAKTELSIRAYQNYDRLEFIENSTTYTKDIQSTIVRGFNLQFNEQLWEIYRIVAGFDYTGNFNDSTNSGKHEYSVSAGYLENIVELFNKRLNINLSARLDNYSNFGLAVDPSLSMFYKFNEFVKIHALVSRSFRAPTFNDLYWPKDLWAQGNPNLIPEKGLSEEIGVEVEINKYFTSGLTYYRSDYKQFIQWEEVSPWFYQLKNVASAAINGLELENKIFITDNFEFGFNYSFLIAQNTQTHKYLVYQPENKIDAELKYNDRKGLTIEFKGQFVGNRFGNPDNTIKIKSFYVFGLSVSKKFKSGITCFSYIDNLLNRKYQVQNGYPMPGFSLTGGLKAEF